jgi:hypothetical protein
MNADGSKPTPLTDQQGEEANWSPDGTKIAFASTRDGDNEAPNPVDWNEELYVVEADCSDVTRLTKIPGNDLWPPPGRQTGRRLAHAKAQFRRPRSYFRTPTASLPRPDQDIGRCYDQSATDVSALGLGCFEKQVGHPYLSPLNVGRRAQRLVAAGVG